jgi:glycosyltransferase involved in cell wall biosynthesis
VLDKNKNLVSVIIPTYKRSKLLNKAINSALNQAYNNIEIIVVDDNDPNTIFRTKTKKLMAEYKNNEKVKYIKHSKNRNGAVARNTGVNNSSGKYIAFLDDDDEFEPKKIQTQLKILRNCKEKYGGVYCRFGRYIDNKKIYESKYCENNNLQFDILSLKAEISSSTLLIKKSVLKDLNGFDNSFERHQDYELLVRFFRKYKMMSVDDELVKINIDSEINRPDGIKLEKVKKQFLSKFKDDICSYNTTKQNKIYSAHYFELFKVFIRNMNILKGLNYFWKSNPDYNMLKNFLRKLVIKFKEYYHGG